MSSTSHRLIDDEKGPSKSDAAMIGYFDRIRTKLSPDAFTPLIKLHGGFSLIGGPLYTDELLAFLSGRDWISICHASGADTKKACMCIGFNYDEYPGMVALALELAQTAAQPGNLPSITLTDDEYLDVIRELYGTDCGGIYTLMSDKWGLKRADGNILSPKHRTRSRWRKELGYDVFIHPVTLEPCRDGDGTILKYLGVKEVGGESRLEFKRPGSDVYFRVAKFSQLPMRG